ncbi:hypothetical protein IL972_00375 [Acinetobacter sp. FL51]|uniref:Bbp19 family protein n=1 Tax=Acinetobacter sp. FL51 TaxID=2777978 RepID=UPI0018E11A8C|nr:hypothetical protein [Acinetobacter sp. FL51]MBI1450393.1 hypothetical protein [Acinetobacter sp. FL51]
MIYVCAVLAILLLIALAGLYGNYVHCKELGELCESAQAQANEWEKKWFDESSVSSKLRNEKHHEWERAEILQEQVLALKHEIADMNHEQSAKPSNADQPAEAGIYARVRQLVPADATTYQAVFDCDMNGQRILEDLTQRFGGDPYVPDSRGGERETCLNLGKRHVVNFIMSQITSANYKHLQDQLEKANHHFSEE